VGSTKMRRDARWTYLLNELGAQDDAVRNGLMEWILSKASSNIYKSVKTPGHIITEHGYIDWRSFFDVTGSVAINKTEGPFLPLLSYDHIFIGLNPCPLNAFNLFHAFTWDDIPKLSEYARNKRVLFYLTDKHDTYGKFGYMQGLFEEFRPLHLPHAHVRLVQMDAFPHPFDAITEAATEQPNIKQAIGSFAKTNFMPLILYRNCTMQVTKNSPTLALSSFEKNLNTQLSLFGYCAEFGLIRFMPLLEFRMLSILKIFRESWCGLGQAFNVVE
jgi:hypothetical protein